MSLIFNILKATGRLNEYLSVIEQVCTDAQKKVATKLPVKNIDIVIADNPYHVIPEIGMGGHTYIPNFILISVDPEFPNLGDTLYEELLGTIAHEVHHVARWQTVGYGGTLLEAIISEGLADHFEIEVTKRKDLQPWDKALTTKQTKTFLEKAVKEFNNREYNHSEWFFGSKSRGIPRWTGYSLGFKLVRDYLTANLDKKPSTLYAAKAKDFTRQART